MNRRRSVGLVLLLVLLAVLAFATVQPGQLVLRPGGALEVPPRVQFVDRPEDPVAGRLMLTTVAISEPNLFGLLRAALDDDAEVIAKEAVIPEGVEPSAYFEAQRQVFVESGQVAAAVGLRAAGLDAEIAGDGAEVLGFAPDSPAAAQLQPRDLIVGVEDAEVDLASELVAELTRYQVGDEVTLVVKRGEETLRPQVRLVRLGDGERAGLGVGVATVNRSVRLPFEVRISDEQIGGPSAGLMIALSVYDLADPRDLTAGRSVAGTGTMSPSGMVGPVGGVEQKVRAAIEAGATHFLVPPAEAAAAHAEAGNRMQVFEVNTLKEAIAALDDDGAVIRPAPQPGKSS